MKYIATFEIPDNEVGRLTLEISNQDSQLIEFKQVPKINIKEKCKEFNDGRRSALKDCGVI